jgi:membrane protease YdiL (CAAX protease family)
VAVFFDSNDDFRYGWKCAAYAGVFFLTLALVVLLLPTPPRDADLLFLLGLNSLALFVPSVVGMLFMSRFVDHVPVETFGVGLHARWSRELLMGMAVAALLLLGLLGGCAAVGSLDVRWTGSTSIFGYILAMAGVLLLAAANEELIFRGYPMQTLMKGIGAWPAVLVMSGLFGLMHLRNPNASAVGIINTVLAGIMLSAAYLKTRSLWFPFGIHVGWNIGLGLVLGFPLSGIGLASLWTSRVAGHATMLGGSYGPEGGVLATFLFVGGTAAVCAIRNRP